MPDPHDDQLYLRIEQTTKGAPFMDGLVIWSWIFGFLGALLAVPATLLLRSLLRSRRETLHLATFLEKKSSAQEL